MIGRCRRWRNDRWRQRLGWRIVGGEWARYAPGSWADPTAEWLW